IADFDHFLEELLVAKCGLAGINEEEEQIIRPCSGAEREQSVSPRLGSGQLLLLEIGFRGIRIESSERDPDDLFALWNVAGCGLAVFFSRALRHESPREFIHLRVG